MTHPLAGGVPRGRALGAIRNIIEGHQEQVTVTSVTTSKGALDQETETTTTRTERLWLFDPRKSVQEVAGGERVQGDLSALGKDGIQVEKGERLTHGGVEYEVDTVTGFPEDESADGTTHDNVEYFRIELVRRST